MLNLLRQHRYELIAFFTGAAVMMLEIVGARLTAPFFGTSTYIWTAIIGVILGALAVGYSIGGVLADKFSARRSLTVILLAAAASVLLIGLVQRSLLSSIASLGVDLRIEALLAALLLFAPAAVLIGLVSPHLAKIRIISLDTSGKSVGRLEAAGALGSIAGTFACGYFLLEIFGSRALIIGVAVLLLLTSFLAAGRGMLKPRLFLLLAAVISLPLTTINQPGVLADVDTSYDRYSVSNGSYGGEPAIILSHNFFDIQSAVSKQTPRRPLLEYIKRFDEAARNYGSLDRALVIGGGAYTFPSILIERPDKPQVDVAEIDRALKPLSDKYFYASDSPRLTSYAQDGRTYVAETKQRYNLVYVDAFASLTPPFQLTTTEAVAAIQHVLQPGGAVVVNVVDDASTPDFLQALMATYGRHFSQVRAYPATYSNTVLPGTQNFIMYASNDTGTLGRITSSQQHAPIRAQDGVQPLTDDFAPVEALLR